MSAATDGSPKALLVGRIVAAHGIGGEVRIESFCADPLAIATYGPLTTDRSGLIVDIASARAAKTGVVARLKGVGDRNAAEALRGVELFVAREVLPANDDADEFYHADLVGLPVRLGDGRVIGAIRSVADYGAGAVVEIALLTGASALYAFTRVNFPAVSPRQGFVVLDPPVEIEAREGKDDA